MTVFLKIETCVECPHSTSERTRGTDSFDIAFDYFCSKSKNRKIAGYVGPFDEEPYPPKWCPLKGKKK